MYPIKSTDTWELGLMSQPQLYPHNAVGIVQPGGELPNTDVTKVAYSLQYHKAPIHETSV